MADYNSNLKDQIHKFSDIAKGFLYSDHPWRAQYFKCMVERLQDLSAAGKERAAALLITRMENTIEKWDTAAQARKTESSDTVVNTLHSKINHHVDVYLKNQKKYYSEQYKDNKVFLRLWGTDTSNCDKNLSEPVETWKAYRQWSLLEIEAWDFLCADTLRRIGFSQHLDFSDYLSETWGPYNTKFNIIESLKRLKTFNQAWLESYLILYESLRQTEQSLSAREKINSQR